MPFDPNLGYVPSGGGQAPLDIYNQNFDPATGQQSPTGGVGRNPYPQLRYGYQGPGYNAAYGTPTDNLYQGLDPYLGNSIDAMAQNNRNRAITGGDRLQQDLTNYGNYQYGNMADYTDRLNSAWDPIAQGRGGYTDAQKEAILNNPALQALRMTPDQQASNYLTPGESSQISGNPYDVSDWAKQQQSDLSGLYGNFAGQIGGDLGNQEAAVNGAISGAGDHMRGSINDWGGRSDQSLSDIAALTRGSVGDTSRGVNSALGQAGSNVRSYIDPNYLTASNEYMNNYQVSPADMQGIMNQAGRAVGAQSAMDEENLQQQARAAGNVNPLAEAAMRNRIRATGAINSANAMSDAAIKAKNLQLATTQGRENTRLGAEQTYAGLGTGNEQQLGNQNVNAQFGLGQQALNNEQYMGSNTLNQKNALGQAGLGAEQYLAGQNIAGQQGLGASRLANTQQLLNSGMNMGQYGAGLTTGALQNAEQQGATRAGTLATNRQGVNQYNQGQDFTRGSAIYGAGSAANTNFANNQQAQENQYKDYLSGAQNQANQGTQVANQQRTTAYGATNQGAQGATTGAIQNYAVPGTWQAIANTVSNFMPYPHAKGTVTSGPETALIGEAGPELLIHLGQLPKRAGGGVFDSNDYASTMYGAPDEDTSSTDIPLSTDDLRPGKMAGSALKPKENPLWKQIFRASTGMPKAADTQSDQEQVQRKNYDKGSKVGGMLQMFGLAKGGIIGGNPHHPYGKRGKPAVEMIKGPQIRKLGVSGADAVIPMVKRPGNKVGMEDIPNLIKKFGGRR